MEQNNQPTVLGCELTLTACPRAWMDERKIPIAVESNGQPSVKRLIALISIATLIKEHHVQLKRIYGLNANGRQCANIDFCCNWSPNQNNSIEIGCHWWILLAVLRFFIDVVDIVAVFADIVAAIRYCCDIFLVLRRFSFVCPFLNLLKFPVFVVFDTFFILVLDSASAVLNVFFCWP